MTDLPFNITVVGLGLIGGSLAMALKELKPKNLWGIDINENNIEKAEKMKIIDKGYTDAKIPLKDSDIIFMGVYPEMTEKFIKANNSYFKHGAIITDTAGIKEQLVSNINYFIREDVDFIGGHPMAGRENKGLEFASKDIFNNANYIFTPTENNKKENIEILEDIVRKIGCKNVTRINPKRHDEIIAYISQLPHIIAVALVNSNMQDIETSMFAAGSFRDATRVADINSSLWVELLNSNSENIVNQIEIFEERIKEMKNAILEKNQYRIKSELEKAGLIRKELI